LRTLSVFGLDVVLEALPIRPDVVHHASSNLARGQRSVLEKARHCVELAIPIRRHGQQLEPMLRESVTQHELLSSVWR